MLLFMDGQAHYDTTRIGHKYTAVSHTDVTWSIAAEGRFGNCLKRVSTSNASPFPGGLRIAPLTTRSGPWVPDVGNGGVCGFGLKVDALNRIDTLSGELIGLYEGGVRHCYVQLNPDGTMSLFREPTTLLAQSSEGLSAGPWMFVECKWRIDASGGSVEVRVNGMTILTYSGDTREEGPASTLGLWNVIHLLGVRSIATPLLTLRMCDLYLADLVSADADDVSDFVGDGIVQTIYPNGAGASTGWTPSAAPNWDQVNESTPDDDATTVSATAAGTTDTYQFQDVPTGSVIRGIHVCLLARKDSEGGSSLAPIVRQGSTEYAGPTQGVANVTFDRFITQAWDLNPATGAKFTDTEINGGQFGVRKVI